MMDLNMRGVVHLTDCSCRSYATAVARWSTWRRRRRSSRHPTWRPDGATKAFLLHWSLALNEELRGTSVRTLAVCPGPTATEFGVRAGLPKGFVSGGLSMTADEVVMLALRALAAERSQVVTGWKNKLSAFAGSLAPKPVAARLAKIVIGSFRLKQVKR
jgi:NAD(P)-dependent dehydrogenase (short-subunit alcohol dehydrogenase family)